MEDKISQIIEYGPTFIDLQSLHDGDSMPKNNTCASLDAAPAEIPIAGGDPFGSRT